MQRDSMASRQGEVAPQFQKGDNVVLWFPTRPAKHFSHWVPGYTVIDSPSADFYYIGKRELDGSIVGFETVPVKRLRLYDARRSPDFGLFMDVKPDHGVVEDVVGHHRNAAGDLAFTQSSGPGAQARRPRQRLSCRRSCATARECYARTARPRASRGHTFCSSGASRTAPSRRSERRDARTRDRGFVDLDSAA